MFSEFAWAVELGEKGCFAGPALAHHEEGAPVGRAGQVAGRLLQLGRPPQEHTGGPAAQVGMVEDLGGGTALRRAWETVHFWKLIAQLFLGYKEKLALWHLTNHFLISDKI